MYTIDEFKNNLFYKLFIMKPNDKLKQATKYSWIGRSCSKDILEQSNKDDFYELSVCFGNKNKEVNNKVSTTFKVRNNDLEPTSELIFNSVLFQTLIYTTLEKIYNNAIIVCSLAHLSDAEIFKYLLYNFCHDNLINYNRFDLKIVVMNPRLFNRLSIAKEGNVYHLDSDIKADINSLFPVCSEDTEKNFYYLLTDQVDYEETEARTGFNVKTKILVFNDYSTLTLIKPDVIFHNSPNVDDVFTNYTINYEFLNENVLLENLYKNTIAIPVTAYIGA